MKWALLAGDEDRKWTDFLSGRLGELGTRKLKVVGLEAWAAAGNGIVLLLETSAVAAYWEWPFREKFGDKIAVLFPTEMGQVEEEGQALQWLVTPDGLKLSWTGAPGLLGRLLGLEGGGGEKEWSRAELPSDIFWFTPTWEQGPGTTRSARPPTHTMTEFSGELQPGEDALGTGRSGGPGKGGLKIAEVAVKGDEGFGAGEAEAPQGGDLGDIDDLTLESAEIPRPAPSVMPAPVANPAPWKPTTTLYDLQPPHPVGAVGPQPQSFGPPNPAPRSPALPTQISCLHPQLCQPEAPFLLEVVLHLPEATPSPSRPGETVERALGNTQLPAGAQLRVEIRPPPGFLVDSPQSLLTWLPPSSRVGFLLTAEKSLAEGSYIIPVLLYPADGSIAFCRVYATVELGTAGALNAGSINRPSTKIPQKIFASYASKDRAEVLERVASLEALGIDVFVDCLDIAEGQHWEEGIQRQVCTRDALLLFWSRAAAASRWVEQEWKLALAERGLDYIFPNALEAPALCPPPPPLAALQFGSALLLTPWSAPAAPAPVMPAAPTPAMPAAPLPAPSPAMAPGPPLPIDPSIDSTKNAG